MGLNNVNDIIAEIDGNLNEKTANFLDKLLQIGNGAFVADLMRSFDTVQRELADRDNPSEEGRSVKKFMDKAKIKVEFEFNRHYDQIQKMNAVNLSTKVAIDVKAPIAIGNFYLTDMGKLKDKNEVTNLLNMGDE